MGYWDKKTAAGALMLLLAALIWGAAFSAQSVAGRHVGAYTFNALRFLLGAVTLLPAIAVSDLRAAKAGSGRKPDRRSLLLGGALCGLALFFASYLQQCGIERTGAASPGSLPRCTLCSYRCWRASFLKSERDFPYGWELSWRWGGCICSASVRM